MILAKHVHVIAIAAMHDFFFVSVRARNKAHSSLPAIQRSRRGIYVLANNKTIGAGIYRVKRKRAASFYG